MEDFLNFSISCEEEIREQREYLKQGERHRGNFGGRSIELPKRLLEKLECVSKQCKKKKWRNCGISSLVEDALIEHLIEIHHNGCLDPDEEKPVGRFKIIQQIVKQLYHTGKAGKFKKKEIIEFAKKNYPNEFQNVSDKTLENYIWKANRDIDLNKKVLRKNTQN
jgi:hypothetical protein